MKRVFSFLLHPAALGVVGFLLLAALIWWAGPLLSPGGSHPLDGVGERVLALGVLLLVFALVFGLRFLRRRRSKRPRRNRCGPRSFSMRRWWRATVAWWVPCATSSWRRTC